MNRNKINKYELYEAAVIDPIEDIRVFREIFVKQTKRIPYLYREDFCGTFAHSIEWVKKNRKNKAWALDLDERPLRFGIQKYYPLLSGEQQKRLKVLKQDVLRGCGRKVDLITATNFSYCLFKNRLVLKKYFECVLDSLRPNSLFLMDSVGGQQMQGASTDVKKFAKTRNHPAFTYFWEQKNFNLTNHEAQFAIHFELAHPKQKIRNAFTYDWRLWTLPELRDILLEAGFKSVDFYFEGTNRSGYGNGIFRKKNDEESCDVWIAYIAAKN